MEITAVVEIGRVQVQFLPLDLKSCQDMDFASALLKCVSFCLYLTLFGNRILCEF